jgi:hypothetical protein
MPRPYFAAGLITAILAACAGPVVAADSAWAAPRFDVSVGALGIVDTTTPIAMGLVYRSRPVGRWSLVPGGGVIAGDDHSRYAYANLSREFLLGRAWTVTASLGAGHFHGGSEVDLGHPLIFQSGIELGRWIEGGWRVGLAFDHLSNAGLSEHNPGTEVLVLRVSMPLGGPWAQPSTGAVATDSDAEPTAASWRSSSRRISSPASAR